MIHQLVLRQHSPPAITRLSRLATLSDEDLAALGRSVEDSRAVRPHREMVAEGTAVVEPKLIVSGWAARVRLLADGRRQLLSFLIPGDLIGMCRQPEPLSVTSVMALTDVTVCTAPPPSGPYGLAHAYAISHALEEAYLLCHIVRLGRLNAEERIGDLMLELHERLAMADLAGEASFELPLTQEMVADALGLTSVHVNRIVQTMRRAGDIEWKGRHLTLCDPVALARKVGRVPVRVTSCIPE